MTPLLQVFFGICGGKVLLLAENQHIHRQQAERLFYWLKKKKCVNESAWCVGPSSL